jgi:hypothetical protein
MSSEVRLGKLRTVSKSTPSALPQEHRESCRAHLHSYHQLQEEQAVLHIDSLYIFTLPQDTVIDPSA